MLASYLVSTFTPVKLKSLASPERSVVQKEKKKSLYETRLVVLTVLPVRIKPSTHLGAEHCSVTVLCIYAYQGVKMLRM